MEKQFKWKSKAEAANNTTNVFIGSINVDQIKNLTASELDAELKRRLENLNPRKDDNSLDKKDNL
jgi:hypothetical protein